MSNLEFPNADYANEMLSQLGTVLRDGEFHPIVHGICKDIPRSIQEVWISERTIYDDEPANAQLYRLDIHVPNKFSWAIPSLHQNLLGNIAVINNANTKERAIEMIPILIKRFGDVSAVASAGAISDKQEREIKAAQAKPESVVSSRGRILKRQKR